MFYFPFVVQCQMYYCSVYNSKYICLKSRICNIYLPIIVTVTKRIKLKCMEVEDTTTTTTTTTTTLSNRKYFAAVEYQHKTVN